MPLSLSPIVERGFNVALIGPVRFVAGISGAPPPGRWAFNVELETPSTSQFISTMCICPLPYTGPVTFHGVVFAWVDMSMPLLSVHQAVFIPLSENGRLI